MAGAAQDAMESSSIDSPRKRRGEVGARLKRLSTRALRTSDSHSQSPTESRKPEISTKATKPPLPGPSMRPPPSPRSRHSTRSTSSLRIPSPDSCTPLPRTSAGSLPRANISSSDGRPPIPAVPSNGSMKSRILARVKSASNRSSSPSPSRSNSPAMQHSTSTEPMVERPKKDLSGRSTFHVRVSLGYLTGIRMEQLSRRKKKNNAHDGIVVGYASLAKTGKQLALSQPLLPESGETKTRSLKLFWASPETQGEVASTTKAKRRLHFSVKLEKSDVANEHDAMRREHSGFNPEVVRLLIGLKCGDEKVPLGIANLVVNGQEAFEQKVDLSLRTISESQRSRLGLFGKKQQGCSFPNHNSLYRLASNATLRVRCDIKYGKAGETKADVWGAGDDSSLVTNWSYDTRATTGSLARSIAAQSRGSQQMTISSYVSGGPKPLRAGENSSFARTFNSEWAEASRTVSPPHVLASSSNPSQQSRVRYKVPMKYVLVQSDSAEGPSLASDLTNPQFGFIESLLHMKPCAQLGLCGEESDYVDEALPFKSYYTDLGEGSGWDDEDREPASRRARTSSGNRAGANSRRLTNKKDEDRDDEAASDDNNTVDVTVDTYSNLIDAQETLMRYASKAGVTMEDLLVGLDTRTGSRLSRTGSRASASRSSRR